MGGGFRIWCATFAVLHARGRAPSQIKRSEVNIGEGEEAPSKGRLAGKKEKRRICYRVSDIDFCEVVLIWLQHCLNECGNVLKALADELDTDLLDIGFLVQIKLQLKPDVDEVVCEDRLSVSQDFLVRQTVLHLIWNSLSVHDSKLQLFYLNFGQ